MASDASTGRVLQTDEGLNVLLNIPDSAKVVAFKPEHPGLWAIKVGTLGFQVESLGCVGSDVDLSTGEQGQEPKSNLICNCEGVEWFGMTSRKVKKETSVNSQIGTWLRILPWVGSVNGARVTLRERAERDRAGRRLLSGR